MTIHPTTDSRPHDQPWRRLVRFNLWALVVIIALFGVLTVKAQMARAGHEPVYETIR